MNKKIKQLQNKIDSLNAGHTQDIHTLLDILQKEYNKVFDKDKELQKALNSLECSQEYSGDENGIYHWFRYSNLNDIPENEKEYFETYVSEKACCYIDWNNDCLKAYEGESLIIQDDTRHDNGVWLEHKLIIPESDYTNEDNEVDKKIRNTLIEKYMEKTGYFPGVFRVDQHGNIFPVNTQPKKD